MTKVRPTCGEILLATDAKSIPEIRLIEKCKAQYLRASSGTIGSKSLPIVEFDNVDSGKQAYAVNNADRNAGGNAQKRITSSAGIGRLSR